MANYSMTIAMGRIQILVGMRTKARLSEPYVVRADIAAVFSFVSDLALELTKKTNQTPSDPCSNNGNTAFMAGLFSLAQHQDHAAKIAKLPDQLGRRQHESLWESAMASQRRDSSIDQVSSGPDKTHQPYFNNGDDDDENSENGRMGDSDKNGATVMDDDDDDAGTGSNRGTPSSTNEGGDAMGGGMKRKKKTRTVFSRSQVFQLESTFDVKRYLSSAERAGLAASLRLTETQVKIWVSSRCLLLSFVSYLRFFSVPKPKEQMETSNGSGVGSRQYGPSQSEPDPKCRCGSCSGRRWIPSRAFRQSRRWFGTYGHWCRIGGIDSCIFVQSRNRPWRRSNDADSQRWGGHSCSIGTLFAVLR